MPGKEVSIIGAGFSGLSAACYLAKAGCSVTVYEKHDAPGGRARSFSESGFVFDMGPSWYWMPDVFERFFADFGKKPSDYYELKRLDPSYRVFFGDHQADIPADFGELKALFEKYEKGSSEKLESFLKEAEYKYNTGMQSLVYKPGLQISELLDRKLIAGLFRLDVFKSLSSHVRKNFSHPALRSILEFPVLFLGAMPEETPALYSLMNYADMKLGTWYPMGGMVRISEAMHKLATGLGVKFIHGSPVSGIKVRDKIATGLSGQGTFGCFDALISSADYHFTEQNLLEPQWRRYSKGYWSKRKLAPSCLIYYCGVRGRIPEFLHHNLFFDENFQAHASQIYKDPQWPDKPLFYVCCPGRTDPTVAPEGCENLFILVPVAPGLNDTPEVRQKYYEIVTTRLKQRTGFDVVKSQVFLRTYGPGDFANDYNAFKGNAYGLANTLLQTAHLKPSLKSRVNNLFYAGQLTVPGPGVPPAIISGKLAAEQTMNYLKI